MVIRIFIRDGHNCVFIYDWQTSSTNTLDLFFRNVINGEETLEWGRQYTGESMPYSDNCGELVLVHLFSASEPVDFVCMNRQTLCAQDLYYFFIDLMNGIVTYGFCVDSTGFICKREKCVFLCTFVSDLFFNMVEAFRLHNYKDYPQVKNDFITQLLN